jgi:hypothetical protein
MPRHGRVFKKRKSFGIHLKDGNRPKPSETPGPSPQPSNKESNCSEVTPKDSTSKVKLANSVEYDQFNNDKLKYDILDLGVVEKLISELAVCKYCHSPLRLVTDKRIGLAFTLNLTCTNLECLKQVSERSSKLSKVRLGLENAENRVYDVNIRFVYALRCIGIGQETGELFAGVMNLPKPSKFAKYNKILLPIAKMVCVEAMKEAVEETVRQNDGNRDITCAFDGTWQRRGFSSLNGVVTAMSITTGQVLDVQVMSKYCQCKTRLENKHSNSCIANFSGTSGGMEVEGVKKMFERSKVNYDVRYKYYLGDGDCKGYDTVCALQPYGPDFKIEKKECVGHVQKRMGKRLRDFKKKNSHKILADGKTIGGKGRLTGHAIDKIQIFYGIAIRRNASLGVRAMKTAIWAEFCHLGSTDEEPMHQLCPTGENSWCKYQLAKEKKEPYNHSDHTHLPPAVLNEIKPIFKDLSNPTLLAKCAHGGTQNMSESLNNVIWSHVPKKVFVRLSTLQLGVYNAIAQYNKGNVSKCLMFKLMGLAAGENCVRAMKLLDARRVWKAEKAIQEFQKKCRQQRNLKRKKLEDDYEENEDPDNPSYSAGHY